MPEPERALSPWRAAQATSRLTVRYNAIVHRVLPDAVTGLATDVTMIDSLIHVTATYTATSVVFCASAIETVRLFLNSRGPVYPRGIGNSSGTLGQYFLDQMPCLASGNYTKAKGAFADTSALWGTLLTSMALTVKACRNLAASLKEGATNRSRYNASLRNAVSRYDRCCCGR